MFDLTKDIDKYGGVPPYASEMYGVYQPLLGWESNLTKRWIQRGGPLVDPRIKRILDGRIVPHPTEVLNPVALEFLATPLEPGHGKSPYTALLAKDLNSELLRVLLPRVQAFVDGHDGKLPDGAEWTQIVDINSLLDEEDGECRHANDAHRMRLHLEMLAQAGGGAVTSDMQDAAKRAHLALMQYESQIAAFLPFTPRAGGPSRTSCASCSPSGRRRRSPTSSAPPTRWRTSTRRTDGGALSPVGFVHLFRQYFFDLGTFLGEPVEHVWLAPGTTIELIEVSTRRTLVERTSRRRPSRPVGRAEQRAEGRDERGRQGGERQQHEARHVDHRTRQSYVYQGTATASFGIETHPHGRARDDPQAQPGAGREALNGDQAQRQVGLQDGDRDDRHSQQAPRAARTRRTSSSTMSCGARCAESACNCRT